MTIKSAQLAWIDPGKKTSTVSEYTREILAESIVREIEDWRTRIDDHGALKDATEKELETIDLALKRYGKAVLKQLRMYQCYEGGYLFPKEYDICKMKIEHRNRDNT